MAKPVVPRTKSASARLTEWPRTASTFFVSPIGAGSDDDDRSVAGTEDNGLSDLSNGAAHSRGGVFGGAGAIGKCGDPVGLFGREQSGTDAGDGVRLAHVRSTGNPRRSVRPRKGKCRRGKRRNAIG
jgi:hypothetical protein